MISANKLVYNEFVKTIYFWTVSKLNSIMAKLGPHSLISRKIITLLSYLDRQAKGHSLQHLQIISNKLNQVSPSFCPAKWYQATIHLQNGHTQSCHHVPSHRVPLTELEHNPSGLHNTPFKLDQRQQMLNGNWPQECQYCSIVEKDPLNKGYSDRIFKSAQEWAPKPFFSDQLYSMDSTISPKYLEVSFGNECQLKCSYCSPVTSSALMAQVKKYGHYQTSDQFHSLSHFASEEKLPLSEANPYPEQFWRWWPTLKKELNELRITGGEPLLSSHTFKLIERVLSDHQLNLNLSINSNLSFSSEHFKPFRELVPKLLKATQIKKFHLYVSLDHVNERAEYIRQGLKFRWVDKNIHTLMQENPDLELTILCTLNILSLSKMNIFLDYILRLKKKFYRSRSRITLGISRLEYPHFLALPQMLGYLEKELKNSINYMEKNKVCPARPYGFSPFEIEKMKRIKGSARQKHQRDNTHFQDLKIFIEEFDNRNGTQFLHTFPELSELINGDG